MIVGNLLLICIIVNLIFISGFIESFKWLIGRIVGIKDYHSINLKPFTCSLCLSFWVQIIYLIYVHQLSLITICFAIVFANMTDVFDELFYTIKELILRFVKMFQS